MRKIRIVPETRGEVEDRAQRTYDREWDSAYLVYKKAIEPYWLEFHERLARAKKKYDEEVDK